jgi:hypothetical protein
MILISLENSRLFDKRTSQEMNSLLNQETEMNLESARMSLFVRILNFRADRDEFHMRKMIVDF